MIHNRSKVSPSNVPSQGMFVLEILGRFRVCVSVLVCGWSRWPGMIFFFFGPSTVAQLMIKHLRVIDSSVVFGHVSYFLLRVLYLGGLLRQNKMKTPAIYWAPTVCQLLCSSPHMYFVWPSQHICKVGIIDFLLPGRELSPSFSRALVPDKQKLQITIQTWFVF